MRINKIQLIKLLSKKDKKKGVGSPIKPIIPPKNITVGIPAPIKPKFYKNIYLLKKK